MYKIRMIGPKYMIAPLAALGIELFPAESEAEARTALENASAASEPALVLITERLAVDLQEEIGELNRKPELNVALIPDNQGSLGLAAAQVHGLLKNSIGSEVIIRK